MSALEITPEEASVPHIDLMRPRSGAPASEWATWRVKAGVKREPRVAQAVAKDPEPKRKVVAEVPFVPLVLEPPMPEPKRRVASEMPSAVLIRFIISECASEFGVTSAQINSHCRKQAYLIPRQVAIFIAKKLTSRSLPDIGRRFGGRDHTTILHSIRSVASRMEADKLFAARVSEIERKITGEG